MPIKAICKWMLLGVLASMSLQSCVYDKSEDCPATPDDNDGKTYMSIRFEFKQLRQSGVETRTFQPSYEDEDYERKVGSPAIFRV